MPPPAPARRNLVFCRVGDASLHRGWIGDPAARSYDVWLDYYGAEDARYAADPARLTIGRDTVKNPRIAALCAAGAFDGYDAVWFPDDDLALGPADVDRLFEIFHRLELDLAQPALRGGSHYSHAITLACGTLFARYTNFVEPMASVFSRRALAACARTFGESVSGWGMDAVWSRLLGDPTDRIAIVDAVTVLHTRPIATADWYRRLAVNPGEEKRAMMARYGVPSLSPCYYGALPRETGAARAALIPPGLLLAARLVRGAPREVRFVRRFWNRQLQALRAGRRALRRAAQR